MMKGRYEMLHYYICSIMVQKEIQKTATGRVSESAKRTGKYESLELGKEAEMDTYRKKK